MKALRKCHKALCGQDLGVLICKEMTRDEGDPVHFIEEQCMTLYTNQEITRMLQKTGFNVLRQADQVYKKDMNKNTIFAA